MARTAWTSCRKPEVIRPRAGNGGGFLRGGGDAPLFRACAAHVSRLENERPFDRLMDMRQASAAETGVMKPAKPVREPYGRFALNAGFSGRQRPSRHLQSAFWGVNCALESAPGAYVPFLRSV